MMGFTDKQRRRLSTRVNRRHVKTRTEGDTTLSYLSGWHTIAEANRIFGHDSWDRETLSPKCIWSVRRHGKFCCLYAAKVRITVRAGASQILRDGTGAGLGRSEKEESAHEIALKAAETDATKRALATFGNPFGLSLYDGGNQNTRTPQTETREPGAPFLLQLNDGRNEAFSSADPFVTAILSQISRLTTLKDVYAFWEANLSGLTALRQSATSPESDPVPAILNALKARGRAVARKPSTVGSNEVIEAPEQLQNGEMAIPKSRRIRDKEHLKFVARHPCLICGRTPAQAHHLRFAQPRAMSMKVSDEFTVPLCAGHHDELHRTGDEQAWWARNGVDSLKVAERLWTACNKSEGANLDTAIAARGSRWRHRQPSDGADQSNSGTASHEVGSNGAKRPSQSKTKGQRSCGTS